MQLLSETTNGAEEPAPDACAKAMLDGMPTVMWFIRREMRRHRTHGLSVPQFRTLVLLDRYPHASLSAVADHLGSTLPTASRIVSGLVKKNLIKRATATTDRRQVSLVLTSRGRSAFESSRRQTQAQVADRLRALSAADRAGIVSAMGLLENLFNVAPPARHLLPTGRAP